MADRFLLKKFASNTNDVGQFGSFQQGGGKIGDGVKTTDPNQIQASPAWEQGWGAATDYGLLLPRLEEMNGVQRVFAEMLWNQWRDGITFWQAGAPVKALQSVVIYQTGDELPKIYINKTGANGANPPPQDTDNWALAFDPTNTQLLSNMEQVVSAATNKYPSSAAVSAYAQATGNPVGTIIIWGADTAPAGHLICNGAAISRTTYANLFNVIGTIWGVGDGNTTFNLPNFDERTVWQSGRFSAGVEMPGALPNITASWTAQGASRDDRRPVLYDGTGAVNTGTYSAGGGLACIMTTTWDGQTSQDFDASRSNSAYGRSESLVIPTSNSIKFCIRY